RATLARNTAPAGISALDPRGTATASATTSIISDNTPSNCGTIKPTDLGGNVANGTTCALTAATSRQNVASGLAAALANGGGETDVLAAQAGSVAIDLTAPCTAESDQRDLSRAQGPGCDAGAYELDRDPETTITTGPTGTTPRLDARFH